MKKIIFVMLVAGLGWTQTDAQNQQEPRKRHQQAHQGKGTRDTRFTPKGERSMNQYQGNHRGSDIDTAYDRTRMDNPTTVDPRSLKTEPGKSMQIETLQEQFDNKR